MVQKENLADIYPLSPMQTGMLFHAIYAKDSMAYFNQHTFKITDQFNVALFEQSINQVISRHDALRTVFVFKNVPEPLQLVLKQQKVNFSYKDIQQLDVLTRENYIKNYLQADIKTGFDLSQDALIRVTVLQLAVDSFQIIWSNHHIIMDGWSNGIILKEVFTIYYALKAQKTPLLPSTVPYKIYIQWLKNQQTELAKTYWTDYLRNYQQLASLIPTEYKITENQFVLREFWFGLTQATTQALQQLATQNQVTISVVIQAIWGILLAKYLQVNEVVFGTVVSGRPEEIQQVEQIVGIFINTIPVKVSLTDKMTIIELLKVMQMNALTSKKYDYYPLGEIQSCSELKKQLFDHIIDFENYPFDKELNDIFSQFSQGVGIDNVAEFDHSHYNFTIIVRPREQLKLMFMYNSVIFDLAFMQSLSRCFVKIAETIIQQPEIPITTVDMLAEQDKLMIAEQKIALIQQQQAAMIADFAF